MTNIEIFTLNIFASILNKNEEREREKERELIQSI